jgi:hypothetical protein
MDGWYVTGDINETKIQALEQQRLEEQDTA